MAKLLSPGEIQEFTEDSEPEKKHRKPKALSFWESEKVLLHVLQSLTFIYFTQDFSSPH